MGKTAERQAYITEGARLCDSYSHDLCDWQMGLGKTAQSISTLEFQRQLNNIPGPFLIVAPLTTLGHWQREVETWTSMVSHSRLIKHVSGSCSQPLMWILFQAQPAMLVLCRIQLFCFKHFHDMVWTCWT